MNLNLLWFLPATIFVLFIVFMAIKVAIEDDEWDVLICLTLLVVAISTIIGLYKIIE